MGLKDDKYYMKKAIDLAYQAKESGDCPYGAILVDENGNIIMEDKNTEVTGNDITGHPELKIAKRAVEKYGKEFLKKCSMYASAEPCTMCVGAIYTSGIGRIVFGISKEQYNLLQPKGRIKQTIRELLNDSGKEFEIIGPMDDMKDELEATLK